MKILPVNLFNKQTRRIENNQYDYSPDKQLIKPVLTMDSVTFTGKSAMTIKDFKKLGRYMTCLYTGEKMMTSEQ